MIDLLKEEWTQDGVAAVCRVSSDRDCYPMFDLDDGFTLYDDPDDIDKKDLVKMSFLIAAAPAMYRILKVAVHGSGYIDVKRVAKPLRTIEDDV